MRNLDSYAIEGFNNPNVPSAFEPGTFGDVVYRCGQMSITSPEHVTVLSTAYYTRKAISEVTINGCTFDVDICNYSIARRVVPQPGATF